MLASSKRPLCPMYQSTVTRVIKSLVCSILALTHLFIDLSFYDLFSSVYQTHLNDSQYFINDVYLVHLASGGSWHHL